MYIHLVRDEKFIVGAMRLFETAAPGQNRWIILRQPFDAVHVKAAPIEFIEPAAFRDLDLRGHVVFVHMMDGAARRVLFSARGARFVWIAWGADLYPELIGSNLFGRYTRDLLSSAVRDSALDIRGVVKRAAFNFLPRGALRLLSRRMPNSFFATAAHASVAAIVRQCFAMIFVVPTEANLLRRHRPRLTFRTFDWNYCVLSEDNDLPELPSERSGEAALIGNSASPTCNHLECLDLALTGAGAGAELDLYLPLSYGDPVYRERLKQALGQRPQQRVQLLETFLPLAEYERILSRCCYVLMGQKRQQAMGNIVYALSIGARVYLDPENPIYEHFRSQGAVIYRLDEFPKHVLEHAGWLDELSAERNRDIVRRLYSWEACVARTRDLLLQLTPSSKA